MTLDRVHAAAFSALTRPAERVLAVKVTEWTATILLDTSHRGGPVSAAELLTLANLLGVEPSAVAIWDGGLERCEIQIDLEEKTPVDDPRKR